MLTTTQKVAIGVGAAAAVTTVVAVGYYAHKSGKACGYQQGKDEGKSAIEAMKAKHQEEIDGIHAASKDAIDQAVDNVCAEYRMRMEQEERTHREFMAKIKGKVNELAEVA